MEQREEGTLHNTFQREPDVLRVLRFMAAGPTLNQRKKSSDVANIQEPGSGDLGGHEDRCADPGFTQVPELCRSFFGTCVCQW